MSLLARSFVVWLLLLVAAVLNGAVRQSWLIPAVGEHVGHLLSTVTLSIFIICIGWLASSWLDVVSRREAWLVGGAWLALTVAFEFLAGHFLFGAPWPKLFADYNLAAGRVWILVLVVTTVTPPLVFRFAR